MAETLTVQEAFCSLVADAVGGHDAGGFCGTDLVAGQHGTLPPGEDHQIASVEVDRFSALTQDPAVTAEHGSNGDRGTGLDADRPRGAEQVLSDQRP